MKPGIYRKEALEALQNPEEVLEVIIVNSPKSWAYLAVIYLFVLSILLWSIFGSVTREVKGEGILLPQNGKIIELKSVKQSILKSLPVKAGEYVNKGDTIAELALPVFERKISQQAQLINQLKEEKMQLQPFFDRHNASLDKQLEEEKKRIASLIKNKEKKKEYLTQQIVKYELLLKKGYITEQQFEKIKDELNQTSQELIKAKNERESLNINFVKDYKDIQERFSELSLRITEAQNRLEELNIEYSISSKIIAPVSGTILELRSSEGDYVEEFSQIASMVRGDNVNSLEAIVYIQSDIGKKVQVGQEARISPSTVLREEYGQLKASVKSVSEYPVSEAAIKTVLGNDVLVKEFSSKGAPIAVVLSLLFDPKAISGYKWTTTDGPPYKINQGTRITCFIWTEELRPINLVIPYLKKLLSW
jgi:HlyD family secretion protein